MMARRAAALCLVGVSLVGTTAPAQDEPPPGKLYAGAGLAAMDFDSDYAGIGYGDSGVGWHLYGGFQLKQWLALELAFDRLDGIEHEGRGSGLEQLRISAEHSALTLQGTFSLSLQEILRKRQPITVFAAVGLARSAEDRTVLELNTARLTEETEYSTRPVLGVGVLLDVSRVRLRTYLESSEDGGSSLRSIGAAAEFRF
jgi:hypothetical protein